MVDTLGPSQLGGGLVMPMHSVGMDFGFGGGGTDFALVSALYCHNFGSWCNALLGDIYLTRQQILVVITVQENEILW